MDACKACGAEAAPGLEHDPGSESGGDRRGRIGGAVVHHDQVGLGRKGGQGGRQGGSLVERGQHHGDAGEIGGAAGTVVDGIHALHCAHGF